MWIIIASLLSSLECVGVIIASLLSSLDCVGDDYCVTAVVNGLCCG